MLQLPGHLAGVELAVTANLNQLNRPRIFGHSAVCREQGDAFGGRLCHQDSIKRVFVDRGQALHKDGMRTGDWQFCVVVIKQAAPE